MNYSLFFEVVCLYGVIPTLRMQATEVCIHLKVLALRPSYLIQTQEETTHQ